MQSLIAPIGTVYEARSGDTRYEVIGRMESRLIVRVSVLWPTGWHVSNRRTPFGVSHVARQLETGNWRAL